MDKHLLLVLSIVEGRHFPKRPHHQLLIEANFDGEALNTETTKHADSPRFNTELAWEINKKSLHQHKLQRTPIKLQVFALEISTMKKEMVGYCIIDLRTAQHDNINKATWHNLLHSKYHNTKPSVKLSLSVETDKVKSGTDGTDKQKNAKPVKQKPGSSSPQLARAASPINMDVVLDDEQGYYLIGPDTEGCEVFVMAVSINGIRSLINLVPSTSHIQAEDGFYFYYSLFDNDVTNETFYDLLTPSIPTERATVRINTTSQRLDAYLRKKQNLTIYLCSSDVTLGEAVVPLDRLTSTNKNNTFDATLSIDGMFPLSGTKDRTTATRTDAYVGVSIVLRREGQTFNPSVSPVRQVSPPKQTIAIPKTPPTKLAPKNSPATKDLTPQKSPSKRQPVASDDVQHDGRNQPAAGDDEGHDGSNHHLVFSIDLRSISNMDISNSIYCSCRYTYPFFGSAAPVFTNPPVYLQRSCEVLLQQSFCQFEFASTLNILHETFNRVPLIIEFWSKSANQKDVLFGLSQINLSAVFKERKGRNDQYVCSQKVPIVSSEKPVRKIGTLHIVLGFQDKGELKTKMVPQRNPSQSLVSSESTEALIDEGAYPSRNTQEYQVAMALEMWRQRQEEYFKSQLSIKEQERMKELAAEWKQRDLEREMVMKKKIKEYTTLETNLKKSLFELEKHQKQINERELQLQRNSDDLAAEYDRKMVELREASRRLKEDYEHQLNLEKARFDDIQLRFQKQTNDTRELEVKLKERENEIFSLKESMIKRPEVKMQSDMNLLLLEKNEMERKIESITKSKIHYKQQWGRALRELARIKMNEQEEAKTRLKKQQQELDHMKLRYLAAEEKKVIQTEKDELHDVKEEINRRLEDLKMNVINSNHGNQGIILQEDDERYDENHTGTDRVAKLIEERDALLQTGVYTMDDPVIAEFDKEIRQMITEKGSEECSRSR